MDNVQDKVYWVWLSQLFAYGSEKPNEIRRLYEALQDFYLLTNEQMLSLGFLTEKDVRNIKKSSLESAQKIIDDCARLKIKIVTFADKDFPNRLRVIYGPPMVLYVIGDISGLDDEVIITIVGTRKCTDYTQTATEFLAFELAKAGAIVVSGCAVGIDTAAHRGAIKAGGRTIGILGCGMDVDYPATSHDLKVRMVKKGALITELPPGTGVASGIFPIRNRIMAALSLGVLVTHAPLRSGSLITVEHALEQGKDVFCLPPYSIFDAQFAGVIKYIRDGAIPVFCAKDILLEYFGTYPEKLDENQIIGNYINQKRFENRPEKPKKSKVTNIHPTVQSKPEDMEQRQQEIREQQKSIAVLFDENQLLVYNSLMLVPKYIDEISTEINLKVGDVLCALTELEIAGVTESLAGRRYALCNI